MDSGSARTRLYPPGQEETRRICANSSRFAYLLALKYPQFQEDIFLTHFVSSRSENKPIVVFRQRWAIETALSGALDWTTCLGIVRETYDQGAFYSISPMTEEVNLPTHVAEKILAASDNYPATLWDCSDAVAAANARKAVRAVGVVAKNENWFASST